MQSGSKQIFFKGSMKSQYFSIMCIFYKIVHVLFCLNFGFFEHKSKTRKIIWKSITILQAVLFISISVYVAYVTVPSFMFLFWFLLYFIHFLLNVVFLNFYCQNATFCQLFRDLEYIDFKLGISNATCSIEKKLLIINILYTFYFTGIAIVNCLPSQLETGHCYNPLFVAIIILIVISFIYIHISYLFVFICIHCRLQTFTFILREKPIINIYPMQLIYKSIADLAETYKSAFDPSFVTTLVLTTIEIMGQLIVFLNEIKYADNISYSVSYAGLFIYMVSIFAPAIYAEKLATKANDLKIILHDKLSIEQDSARQRELELFIRYVESRPLRFRVYRVIPLDASLLGMVLNFVVTYFIVIVQFTYKK